MITKYEKTATKLMKILVADDRDDTLWRHMRFFKNTEHDVIGVENGVLAIESARKRTPDLTITDYDMPTKDGMAVIREIKALYPETKVWLCTSVLTPSLDAEAREAGADRVIWKPKLYDVLVREKIIPDEL